MYLKRNFVTKASAIYGVGDALNLRAFLITYCQQKRIRRNSISIYSPNHWWMFERDGFLHSKSVIGFRNLVPYKNFGCLNLPKRITTLKLDMCIAKNAGIDYSFDIIAPLPTYQAPDIQLPPEFITFNTGYGNLSGTPGDPTRVCIKSWPIEYWEKLISLLKIPCVQIGAGPSCLPVKGATLNLVDKLTLKQSAEVMRRALFHIDIEGGLPILNQHLGKRSVVLFGPTAIEQQGRSNNLNLAAKTCSPCYEWIDQRYDLCVPIDQLHCHKHCMTDLTPEYVAKRITEEML